MRRSLTTQQRSCWRSRSFAPERCLHIAARLSHCAASGSAQQYSPLRQGCEDQPRHTMVPGDGRQWYGGLTARRDERAGDSVFRFGDVCCIPTPCLSSPICPSPACVQGRTARVRRAGRHGVGMRRCILAPTSHCATGAAGRSKRSLRAAAGGEAIPSPTCRGARSLPLAQPVEAIPSPPAPLPHAGAERPAPRARVCPTVSVPGCARGFGPPLKRR